MATLVKEVADLFASAGIDKTRADDLAAVIDEHYVRKDASELATKGDIRKVQDEMHNLEIRLIMWVVGSVLVATVIDKIWL